MKSKIKTAHAWAWLFWGGLCRWAEPTRQKLSDRGKLSEAKTVAVRIVLEKDYRKLIRNQKAPKTRGAK
jgi:hypothetical protein